MVRRMSEIRAQPDVAELREGTEILRGGANRVLLGGISCEVVDGECVDIPPLDQTDTRRTLIAQVQQEVPPELVLNARIEVQSVRIAKVRVPPFGASRSIIRSDEGGGQIRSNGKLCWRWSLAQLE